MSRPKQPPQAPPSQGPGENLDSFDQTFPVITDPLADILRPEDQAKPPEEVEIPEEVKALFDLHGLSGKTFRCMLKQLPEGVEDISSGMYIKSWSRAFPSVEWIGLNYGPGRYVLVFQFRVTTEDNGKRNVTESIPIFISDKILEDHEEFIFQKKLRRSEERRKKMSSLKLNRQLDLTTDPEKEQGQDEDQNRKMLEYVNEFSTLASALGFNRGGGGTDWGKLLSTLMPLLPVVITHFSQRAEQEQARQREFMTLLISTMTNSNSNMLDIVKAQSGVGSGQNAVKEFKDMLMGVVDIKKSLSENEGNSVADRIFSMIEAVAPSILSMAAMSRERRQSLPQYGMAQAMMNNNPDLRKLKEDPAVLAEVISKWDAHFGWEQADMILDVAQLERPPQCPRLPWQQYCAGNPRNPPAPQQGTQPNGGSDEQ